MDQIFVFVDLELQSSDRCGHKKQHKGAKIDSCLSCKCDLAISACAHLKSASNGDF